MQWIVFTIFIFSAFSSNNAIFIKDPNEPSYIDLDQASLEDNEEKINILLNYFKDKDKENMIEFLIKGNEYKNTALHNASKNGNIKIVNHFLNIFNTKEEKTKLIQYLLKENQCEYTALHFAVNGHKEIVELLLSAFNDDEKLMIHYIMKENQDQHTALQIAVQKQYPEIVQLLINVFDGQNEKEKKIAFLLKEDQYRYTILHDASYNGSKEIVRILLNTFNKEEENEQLIKFVMKEDKSKNTALYLTIINEHEDIVKLLLSVFDIKKDKEKLMEYLMKENCEKKTALQIAVEKNNEEIIKLILNVFGKEDKEKLIEFLMKSDKKHFTIFNNVYFGNGSKELIKTLLNQFDFDENEKLIQIWMKKNKYAHEKILKLFVPKLTNAKNQKLLSDFQFITQMFKYQPPELKKNFPLWSVFNNNEARYLIFKFIITDYTMYTYYYNHSFGLDCDSRMFNKRVFGTHGSKEHILNFIFTNFNYTTIQPPVKTTLVKVGFFYFKK